MVNVIKIIVSMTKKKAHLLYTKQIGGLFHVFMDFSIMDYKYFPIRFHVSNVSKCNSNECLSVRTFGQFADWFYKLEFALMNVSCFLYANLLLCA